MQAFHRLGQVVPGKYPIDSGTVCSKGDAMFLDTDDVKPAGSFTWDTDLATTRGNFAAVFVGIAMEAHASGGPAYISIDEGTESVWEMDQASDTVVKGAPVALAKQSGNLLEPQKLQEVSNVTHAIARCHEGVTSATRVTATFAPATVTSSSNLNASVG